MLFQRVGLCMTQRCSAACSICCFSCSPDCTRRISNDALRFHIRDAAAHPGIKGIGFTGGEPLLCYEEVLELSRYARSLGLVTSINTNGFWGSAPGKWQPRLRALREAGLKGVYFSSDPFHQQFVPPDHLRQALELTLALGLEAEVTVLETAGSDNMGVLAALLGPEMSRLLHRSPLLSAGRAAGCVPPEDFPTVCAPEEALCCFDRTLHVNYDGRLYMCCSQFSPEIPALIVGRTGETTLQEAAACVKKSDVLYLLLRRGPGWFYSRAVSRGLTGPLHAVHPCQLCRNLIGDSAILDGLREEIHREAQALRLENFFNGVQKRR